MHPDLLPLLQACRLLIDDPAANCIGAYAQDKHGRPVPCSDPDAVRWCSVGALEAFAPNTSLYCDAIGALNYAAGGSILNYHDSHAHAEVLDVWDRTIANVAACLQG